MSTKKLHKESKDRDEPKQKRWRPWRPRESSPEADSSSDDLEGAVVEQKVPPRKHTPVIVESITAKADIIPLFNPESTEIFAGQWINKIEQLGAIHNWSDKMKSYFMQSRLSGMAKVWHSSLQSYELSWEDWKRELLAAFPKSIDYVESLREMLAKRKTPNESMTQYYYTKNAMLNKLEIFEEKAVACLIDGLPTHMRAPARAGNYNNPSELYSKFLSVMEEFKQKVPFQNRPLLPRVEDKDVKKSLNCFLCQESGHTVRRCPKNTQANRPNCMHCGRFGHPPEKCWFKPNAMASKPTPTPMLALPATSTGNRHDTINMLSEVNNIYFKTVDINGTTARAYLDSGAKINVINRDLATKLKLDIIPCELFVGGFGGTPVPAKGYVNATVTIDDITFKTKLIITDWYMTNMDVILGQPIVNEPSIEVIISGDKLTINKKSWIPSEAEILKIDTVADDKFKTSIRCKNTVIIPGGHIMMVDVNCDTSPEDIVYVESCRRFYGATDYSIPASVINGGDQCLLQVTNASTYALTLNEGQLLIRGLLCVEKDIQEITENTTITDGKILSIDVTKVCCGSQDPKIKEKLINLLSEFQDCFSANTTELGCTSKISMNIELDSDKPVCYRPYRLSIPEKSIVREKIDELLKNGIIREATSTYASPIILVRKKGGDYRLCVDYRKLNSITVKDKYPLPVIEEQVEKLSGKRFFTSLDLSQGFYQIPMHETSIPKTGFITPEGHYEFLRMPFGLANSPCVFQKLMDKILGALRFDKVLPYIDDLLIPSITEEEGLEVLRTVLSILRSARLTLNLDKCTFLQSKLEYLGYEISEEGIRPGQRKIEAVTKYKEPTNVHELRMFLGLTSYFRKFVRNYASLTHSLYELLKKDRPWVWSTPQQEAFDTLKAMLTERPILALYNPNSATEVHTDASSKGVAGILLQKVKEALQPVAYFSRKTSKEEALYHSFELETLAVVETLKRFRIYLAGIQFKVVTDCVAVRQTFEKKDLLPRVARWWLSIQEYNMEVVHRPGLSHKHVDALSRTPVESTNVNVLDILDWAVCLQNQDADIRCIKQKLENNVADSDISNNYILQDNKLYRKITDDKLRLVIPKTARWNILRKYHDDIGHPGLKRCETIIKENCWFPRMTRFIRKYVNACIDCVYKRGQYGKLEGSLHPIEKKAEPMDTLHIDHLGPFCKSSTGFSYLFVVVDSYTKFVWAKPTKTAKSVEAEKSLEEIFSYFGYPKRIISDSGAAFTSKRFKEFCLKNQVKHVLNAIASPRSNGQVERYNRTLLEAINKSTTDEHHWNDCLTKVIWGMNNTVNSTTGFPPYRLMFQGSRAKLQGISENLYDDESTTLQNKEQAVQKIRKTSEYMKKKFDEKRKKPTVYKEGDLVLWKGAQDKNKDSVRKLKEKYSGPYKVKKILGNDRYIIVSIKGLKGYKKYQATVASDALRRFGNEKDTDSDSNETNVDSTEELIDLLEG